MFSSISKYSNNRTASIKGTFCMACKEGQFDVVELILKAFRINLNAQHVNGMTHFNLALHSGK